jgi:mono/diheme cytochrome c family protein
VGSEAIASSSPARGTGFTAITASPTTSASGAVRRAVVVGTLALAWASGAAASPAVDYAVHCAGCHKADGSGQRGVVPPLAGVARFLSARGGREYLVRVPGVAQSPLGDAALAAVLNWSLARFSAEELPADFSGYTAGEIAALRRSPIVDVEATRRALLAASQP